MNQESLATKSWKTNLSRLLKISPGESWAFFVMGLIIIDCSKGSVAGRCTERETQRCECSNGRPGVQTCGESGQWGDCVGCGSGTEFEVGIDAGADAGIDWDTDPGLDAGGEASPENALQDGDAISKDREHRAVWINSDDNLSQVLDQLKQAHFNTIYFGVWGATHMSLTQVIELAHTKGFDIHLWEANAFICAGQWLTTCTNQTEHPEWFARVPNGMGRKDMTGTDDFFDFGNPAARDYSIRVMVDYAKNFEADGIHFDYIRYDYFGNYSFTETNLTQFQKKYGIDAAWIRGDSFPAFAVMSGNRVTTPTTATVLAEFHDGVPALLVNNYNNGQVLTFNWQAFLMDVKVATSVLQRAIDQFGSSKLFVAKSEVNTGETGGFNLTKNWASFLNYSPQETSLDGISLLPAGSLLMIPGTYYFSGTQIDSMDKLLQDGGNIIFLDGPVWSISKYPSQLFRDIVGVSAAGSYLSDRALLCVPDSAKNHPLIAGLIGTQTVDYAQACDTLDKWRETMQGTVTEVVKGVSEQVRALKPQLKISAAVFPAEQKSNLRVHQNWPLWIDSGYLDYAITMGYTLDPNEFSTRVDWLKTNGYQTRAMPGLDFFEISNCDQIDTIVDQIGLVRDNGFFGFCGFESVDLTDSRKTAASCGILSRLETLFDHDVEPFYPDSLATK